MRLATPLFNSRLFGSLDRPALRPKLRSKPRSNFQGPDRALSQLQKSALEGSRPANLKRRPLATWVLWASLGTIGVSTSCRAIENFPGPIDPAQGRTTAPGQTGLQPTAQPGPAGPEPVNAIRTTSDALASIARLESSRTTGGGYLQTLLRHSEPVVRERATRALGRLPLERFGRNVTGPLLIALGDSDPHVRQAAAFSLGSRGDASAEQTLIASADDEDSSVRAQIYLAMGRIGTPAFAEALLQGLQDDQRDAQGAAAMAFSYWPADQPVGTQGAAGWDGVRAALAEVAAGSAESVRWRALFTLARKKELRQDPAALIAAANRKDAGLWERLFAALGMSRWLADHKEHLGKPNDDKPELFREREPQVARALTALALDPEPRVVTEALRGFAVVDRGLPPKVEAHALQHDSAHVRAAGVLALGTQRQGPQPADMLAHDSSSMVRRAAFDIYIQRKPADAISSVREWGRSRDYRQRRSAALAAQYLETEEARGVLLGLADDKHPQVATEAIGQLKHYQDDGTRERLHSFCAHEDNGRKLAAVTTLAEFELGSKDLAPLIEAYSGAHGDGGMEVCFNALRAAAKIEGSQTTEFLKAGLVHGDPFVMKVAREELEKRGDQVPELEAPASPAATELAPVWDSEMPNPRIAVETNRGTMLFDLYPSLAPLHVHNLLKLVERGHYDGLRWHRVVSDFVIQGGCYRGDGNGGGTWRGLSDSLGQEFSELSYAEGALGMPRNENPDSGGSQIFVTHRPTPHLDGRYTLFGMLTGGKKVLHTVEEGDRILSVRRLR